MREIFLIAIAGALGALGRYGLSSAACRLFGDGFPFGTLFVNTIGCFVIGFVMHTALATDIIPPHWKVAMTVGFIGALTTFSTFSFETITLMEETAWTIAAGNIAANVMVGLGATMAGLAAAKAIFPHA